ncbi:lysozyme [Hymenobacter rigui]|uniref:Lysozyme n=1 Tax=Hymenobacter rigui TaxID=334424 RepID=A0A3R9NE98_9BACT|nr:lysozyme [Hymenobacter rigui]RSK45177.1 lysozyme [Hymenobacter rigui]
MSVNMKTDAAGRAFLTKEEGEVLKTYKCAAGVLTIGVGHTGADVKPGQVITRDQSQALLTRDLLRFEAAVNKLVTVPLTQNQFNALVSFAFNLGEGALAKSSLLRYLNATANGVRDQAALKNYFRIWRNVNGVPSAAIEARRLREFALFVKP